LWTLSIEFFGSLLVLMLAGVRSASPRFWLPVVVVASILAARTSYVCFIVGHVAAARQLAERPSRVPAVICLLGIAVGVFFCFMAELGAFPPVARACAFHRAWTLPCDDAYHLQKRLGSLLVFLSLIQWSAGRRFLSARWLAWWGRLSFPLYLVHWPIVFGLGCSIYLLLLPTGVAVATAVTLTVGFFATLIAAYGFSFVDDAAVRLSHALRRLGRN
jgi:peptidoglycan/LPS O-acetylase OafA/YrhL